MQRYVSTLKTQLNIPLGFHGRNNLAQAVPNTLAAREAGAEYFTAALGGLGTGAGITPLEVLVAVLQSKGVANEISLSRLNQTTKSQAAKIFRSFPYPGYIDLVLAKHRLYFYPQELLEVLADILEMSLDELVQGLQKNLSHPERIRSGDLREYLKQHRLDLDVVLDYLKTVSIETPP